MLYFRMSGNNVVGDLQFHLIEDFKKLSFIVNDINVFVIKTKWVRIESISGYHSEERNLPY